MSGFFLILELSTIHTYLNMPVILQQQKIIFLSIVQAFHSVHLSSMSLSYSNTQSVHLFLEDTLFFGLEFFERKEREKRISVLKRPINWLSNGAICLNIPLTGTKL